MGAPCKFSVLLSQYRQHYNERKQTNEMAMLGRLIF
jgi:hypothetical protein